MNFKVLETSIKFIQKSVALANLKEYFQQTMSHSKVVKLNAHSLAHRVGDAPVGIDTKKTGTDFIVPLYVKAPTDAVVIEAIGILAEKREKAKEGRIFTNNFFFPASAEFPAGKKRFVANPARPEDGSMIPLCKFCLTASCNRMFPDAKDPSKLVPDMNFYHLMNNVEVTPEILAEALNLRKISRANAQKDSAALEAGKKYLDTHPIVRAPREKSVSPALTPREKSTPVVFEIRAASIAEEKAEEKAEKEISEKADADKIDAEELKFKEQIKA